MMKLLSVNLSKMQHLACSLLILLCLPALAVAQQNFDNVKIETVPVAEGIYMLVGRGGNIGLSIGKDGAFIIDDQYAPLIGKVREAIAKLTDQPVKFVINTHWHGDHTGGNEIFGGDGAIIVAQENVRERLLAGAAAQNGRPAVAPAPSAALPVVTFQEGITFHWNDQTIEVRRVDPAHTDGDAIVLFREAKVVHMGDNYFKGNYPFIDTNSGGSIDGLIVNITKVLTIIDDDAKVIPGHGSLSNRQELLAYRDMLETSLQAVRELKSAGKSLAETLAAQPTKDLDAEWGKGFITPERWVTTLYSQL